MTKIQAIKNVVTELKAINWKGLDLLNFALSVVSTIIWFVNLFLTSRKVFILMNPLTMRWEFHPGKVIGSSEGIDIYEVDDDNPNYTALTYNVGTCGFIGIVVNSTYKNYLTIAEQEAIIAHEIGHIVLGHLENPATGWSCNESYELAADKYAAEKVSIKAIKSSITKIITYGKSVTPELTEAYDNAFKTRLDALSM